MRPSPAATWSVPKLTTECELADWLQISPAQLDWLADRKGLERLAHPEPLRNYVYRWIKKRSGAKRLIEAPSIFERTPEFGTEGAALTERAIDARAHRMPPRDR